STIGWTVQQWYIPSWGKAAAIGIALAVMLAIIVCYWSNIVSIFQAIINAFVDAARDFAGQIIDIFNNAKGQARESFTVEVNGVEVALTTTNVSQMQKSGQYYLILKKDSNMYFYPTAVSRIVATAYLRVNRKDIGTYTKEDEDAKVLALDASKSYRVRGSELHNGSGLFFNHYHPYEFETHSWYGEPIWR
ncbi:MAG: hypothetical protein FWF58_03260, partial [Firmicutes bacterium]|nr:hypothetical protein [Bacillota bacterium]